MRRRWPARASSRALGGSSSRISSSKEPPPPPPAMTTILRRSLVTYFDRGDATGDAAALADRRCLRARRTPRPRAVPMAAPSLGGAAAGCAPPPAASATSDASRWRRHCSTYSCCSCCQWQPPRTQRPPRRRGLPPQAASSSSGSSSGGGKLQQQQETLADVLGNIMQDLARLQQQQLLRPAAAAVPTGAHLHVDRLSYQPPGRRRQLAGFGVCLLQ